MVLAWYSCSNKVNLTAEDAPVSSVKSFDYLGVGDKICATLYGKVSDRQATGVPLSEVRIKIDNYPLVLKTNAAGEFEVCLPQGVYQVEVSKPGYQTIQLLNHQAVSDQVAHTEIILGKGTGKVNFTIPGPKK